MEEQLPETNNSIDSTKAGSLTARNDNQTFFGQNYPPNDTNESAPSVPEIQLTDTSPGFYDTVGEDSSLVNEIFETLKMKKLSNASNDSGSDYPSSVSTALNRSRDLDSVNSPANFLDSASASKRSSLTTDDVFTDKKTSLGETSNQLTKAALSPNASPPTRERPVSPRHKSHGELPKHPPKIEEPLKDVVVVSGTSVTLECKFSTPLPETIVWCRNNERVQEDHSLTIKSEASSGKSSLTIHSAIPLDEGIYEVVGKNLLGQVQTSAFLKVDGIEKFTQI